MSPWPARLDLCLGRVSVLRGIGGVTLVASSAICSAARGWDGVVAWGQSVSIPSGVPLDAVVQVSGGFYACAALRASGEVTVWDAGGAVAVPGDLGRVRQLGPSGSGGGFIAIREDGTVRCWRMGLPDGGDNTVPAGVGPCLEVAAGSSHYVAITVERVVKCWGWDFNGQCSVPPDLGACIGVAAGYYQTLALTASGAVRGWGGNVNGELAIPPDLGTCLRIGAGQSHSIAIRHDGSVRCWGSNHYGQCDVPADLGQCSRVSGGYYHSVALRADGTVRSWGYFEASAVPDSLGQCIDVSATNQGCVALRRPTADLDGDLIADEEDNCPALANADQADCDRDAIGDACAVAEGAPDFDGNGVPDSCECIADLFADGAVNGADLGALLSQWGPASPTTVSDMNRDGIVDGADLGFLLVSWGDCSG